MFTRWWTYQRERFPILAHGALIAAFSSSAVSFSLLLRDGSGWPTAAAMAVAFVTCFLFFLQLRIADEFKDHEDDCKYRPYRPVPRGLVSLRELGIVGLAAAAVQFALALWLAPRLLGLLFVAWGYLVLMRWRHLQLRALLLPGRLPAKTRDVTAPQCALEALFFAHNNPGSSWLQFLQCLRCRLL